MKKQIEDLLNLGLDLDKFYCVTLFYEIKLQGYTMAPDEATAADNGNVVRASGVVLEPQQVAEIVVATLREETFLILPHPEVAQFVAKKATEHQRWLAGMRKLQLRTLGV